MSLTGVWEWMENDIYTYTHTHTYPHTRTNTRAKHKDVCVLIVLRCASVSKHTSSVCVSLYQCADVRQ